MLNKKKKGFTLTELIIVIVIIGILAAVLIPSITGYIQKAKRSNDVQLASEMSKNIQYYCIENDVDQDKLLGTDIRTIVLFRGFDLKPRTDKWTFVYNTSNKKVEVKDFPLFEGDGTNVKTSMPVDPVDPTNYETGYYLLGKGKSNFEKAVDKLCNLQTEDDYNEALNLVTGKARTHIEKFSLDKTLYVSNSAICVTKAASEISKIVYVEKTVSLPKEIVLGNINSIAKKTLSNDAKRFKSAIIKSIEKDSEFKDMYPNVNIIQPEKLENIELLFADGKNGDGKDAVLVRYVVDKKFINAKTKTIEIIPVGEPKLSADGQTIISTSKWVATFYDENGAFARGEKIIYNSQPYTQK